ncbi:nucleotide disphospho-sugar-binding domain-containing protein, partial [Amycolatopsis lurida]
WEFDAPELARRAMRQGAAIALHGEQITSRDIREHLLELIGGTTCRERAGQLREEIRAQPSPNDLVDRLEELTAQHRTR